MKKYLIDFKVIENKKFPNGTSLLTLVPSDGIVPPVRPGQFVNIKVSNCENVFLRRPISICDVDYEKNSLSLFVKRVGDGTNSLCDSKRDDKWNFLLPLGNGFEIDENRTRPLLVGGGVGTAPLVYLGKEMAKKGMVPRFLLGGASKDDLPLADLFNGIGHTDLTTVDGSVGTKGFVTDHEIISSDEYDCIYCCGPTPMMKAVASIAAKKGIECYASLENMMACGLGACLCCVEDTKEGQKCVCTDGPVFNVKDLKW